MCEDILKDLETDLEEYNEIFLVSGTEEFQDKIVDSLFETRNKKHDKILVLASLEKKPVEKTAVVYRQIGEEAANYLCGLYYMYEFSNRFHLISKMNICGSLFCLEDTGVIKFEEVKAIWTR